MKLFTKTIPFFLLVLIMVFTLAVHGQSVLNPTDSVVTYNAAAPSGSLSNPNMPDANTISKWIRTVRLSWNTKEWKAYILHTIPFRLKYPKSYDPNANDGKKYPMLIFWHGAGEKGPATDNEFSLANGGPVFQTAVDNGTFDGYVLVFQTPGNGWSGPNFDLAVQVANYMVTNNKLDPFRIISNGLSAGGYGSWGMLEAYPNYLAAALPMSGITLGDSTAAVRPLVKFTPLWDFQGGLDTGPDPNTAQQVVNGLNAAGANLKYTLYPKLGHGTWTTAWAEPDFFPFCNRAYMANPWTLFGRTQFCPGDPINVTIGVAPTLGAYQWRKDGVLLASTTNTITATATGTYDCRVQRNGVWSDWSHTPVVISIKAPTITPPIAVSGLMSKVIPALDNAGVTLKVPSGYVSYTWQKVGSTTTIGTDSTLKVTAPGNYIVQVTEQYGCSSSFSAPFTVINANGPNKPDPASGLSASPLSQTSLLVNWSQNPSPTNNETNFEVYQSTQAGGPYKLIDITGADVSKDTIRGLDAGVKYYYIVRAVNNTAASAASNEGSGVTIADVQAPTAPSVLTITGTGRNSVSFSWGASTDNVGVIGYDIYVNGAKSYTVPPTQTKFTVNSLVHAQSYAFTVKAKDLAGNISSASNQVSGQALINGLPYSYYNNLSTSLTKLPDFGSLEPAFAGTSANVTLPSSTETENMGFLWEGYIILPTTGIYNFRTVSDDRSKLFLGSLNGTGSPYSFTGTPVVSNDSKANTTVASSNMFLSAGIYPIAIAYSQLTGSRSLTVSWKVPGSINYVTIPASAFIETAVAGVGPNTPSNMKATSLSYKAISLAWTDNSSDETGFEIWRSVSPSSGFAIVGSTSANATSFIDSTVAASTRYFYILRSVNTNGQSNFTSNYTEANWRFDNSYIDSTGNGKTLTAISSPVFDAANKQQGAYSVKLNGTNQAITINNTGGFLQESYTQRTIALWIKASSTSGANRVIFDIGGSDNGLALVLNNTTLTAGVASANNRKTITTTLNNTNWNHIAVVYYGDSLLLYVNGILAASNINLGFHSIGTTSNGARIGQTNGTNAYNNNGNVFGGWIDDFGVFNTALSADVIATLINFTYAQSNAATQVLPAIPAAPSGLNATATGTTAVSVSWTNNAVNAANNQLYRSNNNNQAYVLLATLPANATSYNDAGLYSNAQYFYKINAVNPGGTSAYSNESSATTLNTPPVIVKLVNQQARYGTTTTIQVSATSVNSGLLTLTAPNLPAFAGFVDNGNGSGTITLNPASTDQGTYNNLIVVAADAFGGKDTTRFNLDVNNNFAPTLDSIANFTLNESDSVNIPINGANVNPADVLTVSVSNLPNNYTLTPGSNGTATLSLHPTYAAAGTYNVNVTVNDNNGLSVKRTFVLNVINKDPNTKIYARVQYASTASAPWNNMTGPTTPNLLDQNGNTTAIGINFQQSWWMPFNAGPTTGNNSGVYPDAILSDFWYFGFYGGPETAAVAVTGLNPAGKYNITLYAGSNFVGSGDNGTTIYTIGTQSVSLYVQGNTQNTVSINNLSPDATGAITVNMKKGANTPIGYLNALVITSIFDDGTVPAAPSLLTAQNVPGKGVQLNWQDAAYNETAYEVYRSSSSAGTYSLIKTADPGTVSFLDSVISGTTQYFYAVRSVNSHGASTYSDTASVTTTDRIPQVAPIADVLLKNNQNTTVTVTATDDVTDHITLTATNLPPFASFMDNGDGTGTVTIQPTAGLQGSFSGLTVTATDNSDSSRSASFNLFVVDANVTSSYVNLTNNDNLAPAPWNNMAVPFLPYAGFSISGLKDDGNTTTSVAVTLTDAWDGVSATGTRRRNGSELYPESVERSALYTTNTNAHRITVTGLDPAKLYNFVFYNSDGTSASSLTNFTINGQTIGLNGSYNSNTTAQINGISSDASGTVVINCVKDAAAAYGLLSSLVIQSYTPASVTTLSPADLRTVDYSASNTVSLQWQDRASNETGYEVWRANDGGTYSLKAILLANSTSYVDVNLPANTSYNYIVRAVNGINYSEYSNPVRGYTYATTVFINFNSSANAATSPWNNLNWVYGLGATWNNFNDEAGIPTNIGMVQPVKVDGMVSPGVNTGNNSGIFPDKVIAEGFGMFPGDTTYVVLNGLNLARKYDLTVFASLTNYPGENSTVYMVNGKNYLLNSLNNSTGTLTIFGIAPDQNGQIKVSFTGYPTATFGLLGAMIVKGYDPSTNQISQAPVSAIVARTATLANGNQFAQQNTNSSILDALRPLTAYPNPFDQDFTLSVPALANDNALVTITDVSGRQIYQKRFEGLYQGNNQLRIQPAGAVPTGVYYVTITYINRNDRKTLTILKK
ncbi:fibronectin type III domain-containing protein [Flavitalea flava]